MREVVAECAHPVMLYSIGKDSSVMLHLAMKAFYPAKPPFPLLHVDTTWKFREMIQFRDETAKRLGLDLIVHINQEGVAQGHQPVHPRLGAAHRDHEDGGAETGARQIRVRRGLRRRAPRRGKEPRQGAHLFVPRGRSSLGSQEPAAGAVAALQHPNQQGREHPRLSAVELDRARRLAIHLREGHSRSCRSTSPSSARWWSATACSSWSTTTACRLRPARCRNGAWCASARSAAIR